MRNGKVYYGCVKFVLEFQYVFLCRLRVLTDLKQIHEQELYLRKRCKLVEIWVCVFGLCVHVYICIGMGWKITMLVLSSLALVLGTVILILNVYSNR